jgi:L-alanine-DL-glutamate epimerase-like enolase superfamily enzyme
MADVIERVEFLPFEYPTVGAAPDYSYRAAGSKTYVPGAAGKDHRFAIRMVTTGGVTGEYVMRRIPGAFDQAEKLAQVLIGRRWQEREGLYTMMRRNQRSIHSIGLGALDITLWDLAGKAYGASISELLGGFRKELPAYVSTHNSDRNGNLSSKEAIAEFADRCCSLGFKGFKVHGWHEGDPREEAAVVRHLGERFSGRLALMLDPACVFDSFMDALYVGRACEDAGFLWLEDPLRSSGLGAYAHKQLRDKLDIIILQTERVYGPEPKADFVLAGGSDALRVDPNYDLGITGAMKIAHFAESLGIDVELHGPGPVKRHVMSAIRNTNFYEVANASPGFEDCTPPYYVCGYSDRLDAVSKKGSYPVPAGRGMAVEYDWAFIDRHKTAHLTVDARSL